MREPRFTSLSFVDRLPFLDPSSVLLFSEVQGRTYANMFGLVERFIGAKMLEVSRSHGLGDQVALEALVRFTDEELKHQEMFRRIESMIAQGMPVFEAASAAVWLHGEAAMEAGFGMTAEDLSPALKKVLERLYGTFAPEISASASATTSSWSNASRSAR